MTALATSPVDHLPPIGLTELVERAGLQTRVDRKYLVPVTGLEELLAGVERGARVLEIDGIRTFGYESVYFDTPDLLAFHLAAHRRRRRFKVRTRRYLDSGECWLEVKTRGPRGCTVKTRSPYDDAHRATVEPGRGFVTEVLRAEGVPVPDDVVLLPTLVTRYLRTTVHLPGTDSRVTIDTDLSWQDGGVLEAPHLAVVETKTGSTASSVDRLLWARGHRPVRISKYGTGLAALHPELPSTPWSRTLRRQLLPQARLTTARAVSLGDAASRTAAHPPARPAVHR